MTENKKMVKPDENKHELPRHLLGINEFSHIEPGTIFAKGETLDDPFGLNMTGSGKALRFVAKKGFNNDWCVYTLWAYESYGFIASNGDKVQDESNIQHVVPCTAEVLARYRH